MKKSLILASLLLIPFAIASAVDEAPAKPKRDPGQLFKALDKDANGTLSYEEWQAGVIGQIDPARQPEVFKKKDGDGDGKLTLSEYMHVPPREVPKPATDAKPEKKAKKEKPAAAKSDAPKQ